MESHSHADDIITLPSDSQSGTPATSAAPLFVECPGNCKRRVALDSVKLASDGRSRAIWTCSSCSQIQKKQIKFRWYNLVCVQCTHTDGKTCLIDSCARNCPTKRALEKKKDLVRGSKPDGVSKHVFKYKNKIYQSVTNFCITYERLKNADSESRADVMNTDFPTSAYLVVPGHSSKNYMQIPENWKNGARDLSDLEGAAYILEQKTTPTGPHLLLVCQKELRRKAESALSSEKQKKRPITNWRCKRPGSAKSHIPRKRPAQELDGKQSSTSMPGTIANANNLVTTSESTSVNNDSNL